MQFSIEPMAAADWEQIRSIYLEGVVTGQATFETDAPTRDEWDSCHLPACRLVAKSLQERCGFRLMGRRERVACHNGVWRDTILTERRSAIAGQE